MTEKEERSIDAFFQTFFCSFPSLLKATRSLLHFWAANLLWLTLSLSLSHTHIYIYSEQHKTILAMETVIRKVLAASHLPDNDKKRAINTLLARGVPTLLKPDASLLLDLGLDLKSASVPTPFNSVLYLDTLGHLIPISINPLGLCDT